MQKTSFSIRNDAPSWPFPPSSVYMHFSFPSLMKLIKDKTGPDNSCNSQIIYAQIFDLLKSKQSDLRVVIWGLYFVVDCPAGL